MKYMIGNQTYPTKTREVSIALDEAHTTAWPGQIDEGKTIFIFRNEDDLHAWAREVPEIIEQIERVKEITRKAQEVENDDHTQAMIWQNLITKRIMSDMQSLADQLRLDPTSEELFKRAVEGVSVLVPPVLRSAILFDRPECGGAWRTLPSGVPFPNLSWIGFNDRAGAVRVHGFLWLWKNRWFRQRSAFFTGWPLPCLNLADVNFDNSASSAISA
jgi:hypothetical protein